MPDYKTYDFVAGDILTYQGQTYQVHENLGVSGLVTEYPCATPKLEVVDWNDAYQKTGFAPIKGSAPQSGCGSASSSVWQDPQQEVPLRILDASPPAKK